MGESPWEFESPLRHQCRASRETRGGAASGGPEGAALTNDASPRDLDAAVLRHLNGYPDALRRFSNLMKQAHPRGRSAVEFFLGRPAREDSFLAALCRLVRDGEDVVTVVEAAAILGCPPGALLDPASAAALPAPLAGTGRHRIWRRADIAATNARSEEGGGAPWPG